MLVLACMYLTLGFVIRTYCGNRTLDYGASWRPGMEWRYRNVTRSGTWLVNYHTKCSAVSPWEDKLCDRSGTITACLPFPLPPLQKAIPVSKITLLVVSSYRNQMTPKPIYKTLPPLPLILLNQPNQKSQNETTHKNIYLLRLRPRNKYVPRTVPAATKKHDERSARAGDAMGPEGQCHRRQDARWRTRGRGRGCAHADRVGRVEACAACCRLVD